MKFYVISDTWLICVRDYVKIAMEGDIMIYTYKEALKKYKNPYFLRLALKNKEIIKIESGIYADTIAVNPLIIYSIRYPDAIITMDSALYYYGLTDVIPQKVYLATTRKAYTINNKKISQIFMSKDILYQGKVQIKLDGYFINIYDKERLLIEFIRKRKSIPFDYYKEVISNYRDISHELDMYKINEYISLFKNKTGLFDILQKEVF